jgi:hypothetical protein
MSTKYGFNSTLITSDWINSVTISYGSIIQQGNIGINGGYEIYFNHEVGSCAPGSGVQIELKDIKKWTHITFEWLGLGNASCWTFCPVSNGYGGIGPSYLETYDESKGDFFSKCNLTWEVAEYQSHNRMSACDNYANNFFRFNAAEYKSFYNTRRRDSSGNLAVINHGRTCSSLPGITIFRNIYVW